MAKQNRTRKTREKFVLLINQKDEILDVNLIYSYLCYGFRKTPNSNLMGLQSMQERNLSLWLGTINLFDATAKCCVSTENKTKKHSNYYYRRHSIINDNRGRNTIRQFRKVTNIMYVYIYFECFFDSNKISNKFDIKKRRGGQRARL